MPTICSGRFPAELPIELGTFNVMVEDSGRSSRRWGGALESRLSRESRPSGASVLTSAALQEADCLSRRDSSGDLLLFFPEPNLDV